MLTGRVNAPELHTKHGWLNTDREWTIKDLRGKIVLLDFWTFGCINCQHIVPDLKRLEEEFADVLVVIGVHSAKFDAEKRNETISQAMRFVKSSLGIVAISKALFAAAYSFQYLPLLV